MDHASSAPSPERRLFLRRLGGASLGLAVVGLASCSGDDAGTGDLPTPTGPGTSPAATDGTGAASPADGGGADASGAEAGGLGDGDEVMGLRIVATPGHTAGHVSVLDPAAGLLVAGDALNGDGGGVLGPNPEFSSDMTAADESVRKLAELDFETVVFGHGDPVTGDAAAQVRELAAGL